MIYIPILGAIALAIITIMERLVLKHKQINIKYYQVAAFLSAVIVMIPLLFFFWKLDSQALQTKNIIIFTLIILFSVAANLLLFYSLKKEKVEQIEPAIVLEPLFAILIAIVFSFFISKTLYERNLNIIIPAIIAGLALVFTHIKKHHICFTKYFISAILASFFFALELITTRLILDYYTPISFYFFRSLGVLLISAIIFFPTLKKTKTIASKLKIQIFVTGSLWVAYRVLVYYGFIKLGVIFTILLIMLAPIFVFLFAKIFLKEKIQTKNIVSSIIIILCVLYAVLA